MCRLCMTISGHTFGVCPLIAQVSILLKLQLFNLRFLVHIGRPRGLGILEQVIGRINGTLKNFGGYR